MAGIGTPYMDGNTRLCTATADQALKESFGSDGDPGSYADINECDTLFLVGHNVAETQTVMWMRMLDRLHGPDRPRLVVDPRSTPAAREADVHLAIRNGTNLALLNGIQHELIANDWVDHGFVEAHTVGFEQLGKVVTGIHPSGSLRSAASRPSRSGPPPGSSGPPTAWCRPASRACTSPIRPLLRRWRSTASTCLGDDRPAGRS
jgi:anaerobic selenocysteine-containing dehydrogenase